MRISVFGLGYVGSVSAACLAHGGHEVIGVDVNPTKVDLINKATVPVIEAGLDDMIKACVADGRLRATTDARDAIKNSDLTLVCVGTPSQRSGGLDLNYVDRVCEEVGAAINGKNGEHIVVIRSTILPGTMASVVQPAVERMARRRIGDGIGLCHNPEFLREGTAVRDYYEPPKIVIGANDRRTSEQVAKIYTGIEAPLIITSNEVAELVKYADNSWHAVKVSFANEIGNIAKAFGVDSHEVMKIFCQDTKLNLSPYYMKPGFAFGGSCLPKDVRALTYAARKADVATPLLNSLMDSNRYQVQRGLDMVLAAGKRKVGVLGFSFKAGTDDMRESPVVEVIESLIGKGYDLRLYDKNVSLSHLIGANRDYLETRIPHIHKLIVGSIDEVLEHGDTLVVGNTADEFKTIPQRLRKGQKLIDLVRIVDGVKSDGQYEGICW
ncbi:MAG: UDP-glucose/GDP-mannose dehydrogenase family protein [Hyphomicrobiales bacterium]|nr:UDP-glucose/GDP-mannose dehydrogenase family protein [Hyphomicrobiales bacterium]